MSVQPTFGATAMLIMGIAATSIAADATYPPQVSLEVVQERVEAAAATPHPRLLATAETLDALRDLQQADSLRGALARAVVAQATAYEAVPPATRTLQGRRLLGESRRVVKRVVYLATAYHLTGENRFAERCEQEMLAAAGFADWNPSHFLDVGEMAFALAIGYDWLHDVLPESSRDQIRAALVDKAMVLPFTTRHRGWVRAENNWGQVCHGGLTAAALAVLEHEPEWVAKTVHQAAHNVPRAMAAFAPHGSYPEGPGYWSYGTTYNVLLIAVLESALGTDFGLSLAPGFAQTGQYINLATGPSGRYFNYADGGDGRAPEPAAYWLAQRYRRPDWTGNEPGLLQTEMRRLLDGNGRDSRSRFLPFNLLWMGDSTSPAHNQMPLHWSGGGSVPITLHRSSWTDPEATFVGLKGGSPSANHGQMDTGSFVLDALGLRWAVDLGAEGYHKIEARGMNLWDRGQGSDRWTLFRQSNHGHNTLVIDGKPQWVAGVGRFIQFSDDLATPFSVLDMSEVYADQAASVQRGVAMLPTGEVWIRDELRGLQPGSRVRWGMITPAEAGEPGAATILLSQRGRQLTLSLMSPGNATWQIVDTATPREEWDSPNRNTRMVAAEAGATPDGTLVFSVRITARPEPAEPGPMTRSLAEWSDHSPFRSRRR